MYLENTRVWILFDMHESVNCQTDSKTGVVKGKASMKSS